MSLRIAIKKIIKKNESLNGLISFILKPNDIQIYLSFSEKIKWIGWLLLFEFLITLAVVVPIHWLLSQMIVLKESRFDYSHTLLYTFFLFVLILPLIEEVVFRYFLRYSGIMTLLVKENTWHKIFPYLIYLSTLAFGFVHLYNYENQEIGFLLLGIFIVLSQLTGGIILAFIRVRFSIYWSWLMHSLWNLIVIIVIPLLYYDFAKPFELATNEYKIKVTEKSFFEKNEPQVFLIDSGAGKIFRLKIDQYSLQHILDSVFQPDKYYTSDELVYLRLESTNGITKTKLLAVLRKEYKIHNLEK